MSDTGGVQESPSTLRTCSASRRERSHGVPNWKVAIIIREFGWRATRVDVRLRLCGHGLRSRSSWLGAEVDGKISWGPAHRCRAGVSC